MLLKKDFVGGLRATLIQDQGQTRNLDSKIYLPGFHRFKFEFHSFFAETFSTVSVNRSRSIYRDARPMSVSPPIAVKHWHRSETPLRASSGHCRRPPNGIYGISGSEGSASFRLDIGGLYYLAPFLGFVGDQLAELGRRSRQRRAAEVGETGLHLRVVESRVDLLVELVDDLGRRGPRYAEAVPITR